MVSGGIEVLTAAIVIILYYRQANGKPFSKTRAEAYIIVFEGFSDMALNREYVEKRDGAYRISGTRVSLDSIVYAFLRGASPESIVRSYPTVSLEQVYGAITFYLAHQSEVDAYLKEGEAEFEALRQASRSANPLLYKKLEEARQKTTADRS